MYDDDVIRLTFTLYYVLYSVVSLIWWKKLYLKKQEHETKLKKEYLIIVLQDNIVVSKGETI